jgi:integrase
MSRHDNDGIRKLCECSRRKWAKCPHPWHMNFAHDGRHFRLSLARQIRKLVLHKDDPVSGKATWKRDRATLGDVIDSKTAAEGEAERLKVAIRDGSIFDRGEPDRPALDRLKLSQLLAEYRANYLEVRHTKKSRSLKNATYQIELIKREIVSLPGGEPRAFGDWFVVDVTLDAIEKLRAIRRTHGIVGANRKLAFLRAVFNWAILRGLVETTPFKKGTATAIRLEKELPRRRRLEPGEAERLLHACAPHLRGIVEAALETGCRLGELLSLQWHQVRSEPRRELVLPASKTKTRSDRRVPISTRLAAILAMRRAGPDGVEHPPDAYVFGNEVGQSVKRVSRAWERAVLLAHGHTPAYDQRTRGLVPASRAQLRAINLHFHDLRREAGSRCLDGGVPLHTIRDWLGHTNISQTSTYLESTFASHHDAMRAFEERQARSQPIASEAGTGGDRGAPPVTIENSETQKTTERHH